MYNHRILREGAMRALFIFTLVLFLISACEKRELDSGTNPYDPENPGFVPPSFTITAGPEDGAVVNKDQVLFKWQSNQPDVLFRYRFKEQVAPDWDGWSEWDKINSITLGPLDERGYAFELECKYPGENAATGKSETRTFTVDAVKGPALLFYPKYQKARTQETIYVYLMAEEVEDLTIADFTVQFPSQYFALQSITKGQILDNTENIVLLTKPADIQNVQSELTVSIGLINQQSGFSGTKDLCVLKFKTLKKGSAQITLDAIHFRDYQNKEIPLNASGNAQIVIE